MPKASVTLGDSNSSWSKTGIKANEKKKEREKKHFKKSLKQGKLEQTLALS